MAAVAVVFDGGSSVRQHLMASAMDYDERMRGWCKGRQRKQEGGASRGQQEMMARQPAGTTRQREAARQDDHRIGYLNQCRCYPYQGIGSHSRSVLENEQLLRKLRFWIRVQQRTDEFSLL